MKRVLRKIAHVVFGSRRWMNKNVERVAATTRDARILELGSGRQDFGTDAYSAKKYFDASNEFVQSDVDPSYGHDIVDVTQMEFADEFDMILCLNVLEHVFEHREAIGRIHAALRPAGRVLIQVPMFFPFHDEPHDYWRFTEHSLRILLGDFSAVDLKHRGLRQLPFSYFVVATK